MIDRGDYLDLVDRWGRWGFNEWQIARLIEVCDHLGKDPEKLTKLQATTLCDCFYNSLQAERSPPRLVGQIALSTHSLSLVSRAEYRSLVHGVFGLYSDIAARLAELEDMIVQVRDNLGVIKK